MSKVISLYHFLSQLQTFNKCLLLSRQKHSYGRPFVVINDIHRGVYPVNLI